MNMITPFDDFVYLVNNVLLGEEPVSEKDEFEFMNICNAFKDFACISDYSHLYSCVDTIY